MNENQKQTTKTRIYNLIILDKSGSMSSIRNAAFMGCNEVLNGIKCEAEKHADTQEHFVSLMLFDTESMPYILDMVPAEKIELIKKAQFVPCACTPLLDAIGISLTRLETEVKKHARATASVTVITDGYENASTEYNSHQIHELIGRLKEKEGWNFVFMGANQDVNKVSAELNIDIQNTLEWEFTAEGIAGAFGAFRDGTASFYSAVECMDTDMQDQDVSEEEYKSMRRKMMSNRSFFK